MSKKQARGAPAGTAVPAVLDGIPSHDRRSFLRGGAILAGATVASAAGITSAGAQRLEVAASAKEMGRIIDAEAYGMPSSRRRSSAAAMFSKPAELVGREHVAAAGPARDRHAQRPVLERHMPAWRYSPDKHNLSSTAW
jgi:hypothetical protein